MKRELDHKKNQNCTFAPQIIKKNKSKSAQRKKNYNTSAFLKEGLNNYFQRIDRAKKMKGKYHRHAPPPLERQQSPGHSKEASQRKIKYPNHRSRHENSQYQSKLKKPMEMQKTEEDFFNSEQVNESQREDPYTGCGRRDVQDQILKDLSGRDLVKGMSPPSSYSVQGGKDHSNAFAAHTKQLMLGLFSSNETGSLGLIGSKHPKFNVDSRGKRTS